VGLYGLVVSSSGEVWVTLLAENMLARLDVATGHFTYYAVPTPNSEPLALAMGADQTLWFTSWDDAAIEGRNNRAETNFPCTQD